MNRPELLDNKFAAYEEDLLSIEDFLAERNQFHLGVFGHPKSGKTYLAFTAPKPIYIISLDPKGTVGPLRNAVKAGLVSNGDVFINEPIKACWGRPIPMPTEKQEDLLYDYIRTAIENVVRKGKGTLVVDGMTYLYELTREVEMRAIIAKRELQKKELFRFDFGTATVAHRKLVNAMKESDLNFMGIYEAEHEYDKEGHELASWKFTGMSKSPFFYDVWGETKENVLRGGGSEYLFIIRYCRYLDGKKGLEIENPTFEDILYESQTEEGEEED